MPILTLTRFHYRLIVNPTLTAFFLGLLWALVAMSLSRYWLVPNYIPSENGHILGDPLLYHNLALEQVENMREQGWGAFQLHFSNQGTAGVTSLLYLIYPSPYFVVLLNALLHGVACAAVTRLLLVWFSPIVSLLATLPLLISPANIFWLAQINKETYAITGCALFFLGYTLSLKGAVQGTFTWLWLLVAIAGVFLVYIPRPHLNQMLMFGFVVASGFVVVNIVVQRKYKAALFVALQAVVLIIAFGVSSQGGLADGVESMVIQAAREDDISRALVVTEGTKTISAQGASQLTPETQESDDTRETTELNESKEPIGVICYRKLESESWRPVDWLPAGVNSRLKALACLRCHNHELRDVHDNPTTEQSIADTDVSIQSAGDMTR
jgi:hypothetical protein